MAERLEQSELEVRHETEVDVEVGREVAQLDPTDGERSRRGTRALTGGRRATEPEPPPRHHGTTLEGRGLASDEGGTPTG